MIEEAGHDVVGIADDLASAADIAKAEQPDLAFVDMRLASNDSGLEVARVLKDIGIEVFFATGNCPGDEGKGLAIGCMHKPIVDRTIAASLAIAEEFFGGKASSGNLPPSIHVY